MYQNTGPLILAAACLTELMQRKAEHLAILFHILYLIPLH